MNVVIVVFDAAVSFLLLLILTIFGVINYLVGFMVSLLFISILIVLAFFLKVQKKQRKS